MAILPFGPWQPDTSDINGTQSSILLNVLPRADGYGPMKDVRAFTSALPGVCRGAFMARRNDGTINLFAGTATKLYRLDNTTFAWTDVSDGGGSYSALSSNTNWQFAQYNTKLLAVQQNVVPQVFDLEVGTEFATLTAISGTPPQAGGVTVINGFLVMFGILGFPRRIHWSGLSNINSWATADNTYAGFTDLPDGGNVQGVVGGEFGIALQDHAIRKIVYAPGSTTVFQIDRIANDVGAVCSEAICEANGVVYFLSPKGFMKVTSDGALTPIGFERVDRTFLAAADLQASALIQAETDPATHNVFFTYKETAYSQPRFNKALVYNFALDRWSPIELVGEYLVCAGKPGVTLEGLDTLFPDVDLMEAVSYDDFEAATLNMMALFDSSHCCGYFTGDTKEATLTSSEQTGLSRRVFVRGLYPQTDAAMAYGCVGRRENLQAPPTYSSEVAVNALGMIPARVSTRHFRMQIRVPAGTSWTFATGVQPDYSAEGGR